jgi:hypothetical protein
MINNLEFSKKNDVYHNEIYTIANNQITNGSLIQKRDSFKINYNQNTTGIKIILF